MATYLTGSRDLARECGLATVPLDVETQIGELNRIVNWYRDAYTEIQARTAWRWLRHGFYLNTVAATQAYAYTSATDETTAAAITRFRHWQIHDPYNPPKSYLLSAGSGAQYFLSPVDWPYFNRLYNIGNQAAGPPVHVAVDPRDRLVFGPTPSGVYRITGEYDRSAQVLTASGDVPEMPAEYHDLIWKMALKKYGAFEAASEVLSRYNNEALPRLRQLERTQMPTIAMAGPLC